MRTALPLTAVLALLAAATPVSAAERKYSVTDFDRIRIDGPFNVKLVTRSSPFARAKAGSQGALDRLKLEVQGRTLVIRTDRSAWGGYPGDPAQPVELSVGTHGLVAAWVNGAGSVAIDRVRGLKFDLAVEGSGSGSIAQAEVDDLRVRFAGTATGQVSGKAQKFSAHVRGASSLDASGLAVKDAVIAAEGPANVSAMVSSSAKVDAYGTAQVKLEGRPACTSRIYGSASVTGCK
jgi:hypothetical protein